MLEDRWYSNNKAKTELGYSPRYTFEDAIKHTLEHMKRKGNDEHVNVIVLLFTLIDNR